MMYPVFLVLMACSAVKASGDVQQEDTASDVFSSPSEPSSSFAYYTQGFLGEAIVVPEISYDGIESMVRGVNAEAGTGEVDEELIWTLFGAPIATPVECGNCAFAFSITATFDAEASTDPDGRGRDSSFSYALGTSDYGTSLFYQSAEGWLPWITNGSQVSDIADVRHWETVSFDGTRFQYTDRLVDFYYYY